MKILVFGASGYLAQFVVARLAADGHEVRAVFRSGHTKVNVQSGVSPVTLHSPSSVRGLVIDEAPDIVLNMSNYFTKTSTTEDVQRLAAVNVELVTEIALGAVEVSASIFQVGSAWQATFVDGDPSLGSVYALYKGIADRVLAWAASSFGLQVLKLNLFDTYGPRDDRGKIVQYLVAQAGASEPLELSGGEQILELVHTEDVASAVSAGVERIAQCRTECISMSDDPQYWCLPDEPVTLRAVVAAINAELDQPLSVVWGARPYRVGEQFRRDDAIRPRIPGWTPRITLRDGIAGVISSAQRQSG